MKAPAADGGVVWVTTEPLGHGRYTTVIAPNDDVSVALRPKQAEDWVRTVLGAVARAEHDAAIMGQLVDRLGAPRDQATTMVAALRADRPPLPVVVGLSMDPGVSVDTDPDGTITYRPFLILGHAGTPLAQFTPEGARSHAGHVAETPLVADLDSAYRRMLVATLDVDDETAKGAVMGLQQHRRTP